MAQRGDRQKRTRFLGGVDVTLRGAGSSGNDPLKVGDGMDVGLDIQIPTAQTKNAFQISQPDGTVVSWACETGGPNRLAKRGWMRDSLKPGDKVIVHGFPAKDASHSADGRKVTLANGQTIGGEPNP